MNQDQIDLANSIGDGSIPVVSKQMVNIAGPTSPAVLAGLLGCGEAMVYQYRQDGKLPPNSDASYRDSIKHHIAFWKSKTAGKANGMAEAALMQKTQLDRARTEQAWLAIKKERGELVDTKILAETFEPFFLQVRMQLCSIARKHPDVQADIDKVLAHWLHLGQEMMRKSEEELDAFIQLEMEKEIETGGMPDDLD